MRSWAGLEVYWTRQHRTTFKIHQSHTDASHVCRSSGQAVEKTDTFRWRSALALYTQELQRTSFQTAIFVKLHFIDQWNDTNLRIISYRAQGIAPFHVGLVALYGLRTRYKVTIRTFFVVKVETTAVALIVVMWSNENPNCWPGLGRPCMSALWHLYSWLQNPKM